MSSFVNQHGFLPSKSCDAQMLNFQESLMAMLSLNNYIQNDVVYFDFSNHDFSNHDILLMKLKHEYGINGTLLKFLVDYLQIAEQTTMCCNRRPSV